MKKLLLLFGVVAIAAACGVKKDEEVVVITETVEEAAEEAVPLEEIIEEVELPTERPVYQAAETILTDLIHTKLEVNFNWEKSQMNGVATITAKPHFYSTDSLVLDAKGMVINSVKMNGKPLKHQYKNDFLVIGLGKTYTRKDQYTVVIDYIARPEERETGGSAAISSDKGLYFINPTGEDTGKMPQIWTQGETEASSVWFPTIDSPNAKTTQEIFITVEDKYKTLSNGHMVSSKKLAGGKRVDHWKQELPHAPYLFMMGIGEFEVVKDTYTRPNGKKMDVHYYVEPEWEPYARSIFGETPEMIRFFSELTGVEYPWDKYHQIVVRDYVSGAMENTGAVIFGDFVYKNDRELLDDDDQSTIAHELFHHWFGDLVTCESWSNLPLNESFANYSQYLWDEHRYGIDQADYYAKIEADGYYQTAQMQGYHDLIWFDYDDKEQMFDGHSYNKGGRILHMLRNYLGDEAFFEGMRNYLEKNKFKPAEFHQLRLAFEEVSGEDLNWFFNQWFLGSGHPILDFDYQVNAGMVEVAVEQKQNLEEIPIYKLPMEVAIFDDKGKTIHKIVVDELTETVSLPVSGELKNIIFDYQQMQLGKKRESKPKEMYVHQYYNGERYLARLDGVKKGSNDRSEKGQQMILDALNDTFWDIRIEAIGKVSKLKEEKRDQGIVKLKEMAEKDPDSGVRVAAMKKLGKMLKDEKELEAIYERGIAQDSSYSVVTVALNSLGKDNPDKAMKLAEKLESEKSSKMLSGVAQLYAGHGGPEKYSFFENTLNGNVVQGFDKLGLMSSYTYFVSRSEADIMKKSIPMYEKLSDNGGIYMQMFMPQNVNYLIKAVNGKVADLNNEITKHEEEGNTLYADQARKKIKELEAAKVEFEKLLAKVEGKSGNHKLMKSGGDDE